MKKIAIVIGLFLGLLGGIQAQNVQLQSHTFTGLPATSCTNTSLTVNALLLCINAAHNGNTFTVVGSTITVSIDYTLGPICLGALSYPVHNINLGMLPAGSYTVVIQGVLNTAAVSTINTTLQVNSCCPAVPNFTASADTICVGDSIYFSNSSVGSTSQLWYQNNSSQGSGQNFGSTFNTPGSYAIKLVVSDGTCSDSLTKNVLVSSPPSIDLGKDTVLCAGETYLLFAGSGYDSLLWSTQSTGTLISVDSAGTYSVDVYLNGCHGSDVVVVGYHPDEQVDLGADTLLCYGDTLMLDVTASGASYAWHDASTASSFVVTAPGVYGLVRTGVNGCSSSDSITITYDSCGQSVADYALADQMLIYPNPSVESVEVKVPQGFVATGYQIVDLTGRVIIEAPFQTHQKLDVSMLKKGAFILKLQSKDAELLGYFVKK